MVQGRNLIILSAAIANAYRYWKYQKTSGIFMEMNIIALKNLRYIGADRNENPGRGMWSGEMAGGKV